MVDRYQRTSDSPPGATLGLPPPFRGQAAADRLVGEERRKSLGERQLVARRHHPAVPAGFDHLVVPGDPRGDHRHPRGHRLQQHQTERLPPQAGGTEEIRGREGRPQLRPSAVAEKPDRSSDPRRHGATRAVPPGTVSGDPQLRFHPSVPEAGKGAQEHRQPLARHQRAGEEDSRRPGRTDGTGGREEAGVDSVRHEMEVTVEAPFRGPPSLGADRQQDADAIEPPLQRSAEEFGEAIAGVAAVQRGHHGTARALERQQRQHRHERVVHMQQVALLLPQQPGELRPQVAAQGDSRDAAVVAQGNRTAQTAHPGARLHRAGRQAAADHDDMVAEPLELQRDLADVLAHPARVRVIELADHPDLHAGAAPATAGPSGIEP